MRYYRSLTQRLLDCLTFWALFKNLDFGVDRAQVLAVMTVMTVMTVTLVRMTNARYLIRAHLTEESEG
jgi:hypothetical protein